MSLIFIDGFDHYATADLTMKWTSSSGAPSIQSSAGRRSTGCLRTSDSDDGVSKTVPAVATHYIGFALKLNALAQGRLITLLDAGSDQCGVYLNSDGTLSFRRDTTVLSTSAAALSAGIWYYFEFSVTISDASGAYDIKINGVSFTSGSSVDTKSTGNATANSIHIGYVAPISGYAINTQIDYDDFYYCDNAGGTNNSLLGDVRIDTVLPSGNGNSSQMVGSDADSTDNYLLVDEAAQNGDSDYVESATASNKDTYAFGDISHTPTSIFGVQVNMIAKKDDAGARSICAVTRSGGSDTDGATQALTTSYVCYREIRETDPNTSSAWTKTNLNNAEFGQKVAA